MEAEEEVKASVVVVQEATMCKWGYLPQKPLSAMPEAKEIIGKRRSKNRTIGGYIQSRGVFVSDRAELRALLQTLLTLTQMEPTKKEKRGVKGSRAEKRKQSKRSQSRLLCRGPYPICKCIQNARPGSCHAVV